MHPAIIVRQRKAWRRRDGVFLYMEDNAGVIVNPCVDLLLFEGEADVIRDYSKGEMKGSVRSNLTILCRARADRTLAGHRRTCRQGVCRRVMFCELYTRFR